MKVEGKVTPTKHGDCTCDYDALTGRHEPDCPFIQPRSVKQVPLTLGASGKKIGTAEVDEVTGAVTAQVTDAAVAATLRGDVHHLTLWRPTR